MIKRFAAACLATTALTYPTLVYADLVTPTAALILSAGLTTSTAVAVTAANVVVGLVATGASLALGALSSKRQGRGVQTGSSLKQTIRAEEGPGTYAFGRCKKGTEEAYGAVKRDTNDINYRVSLLCFGEIDGIEDYFINDVLGVVDVGGDVISAPWSRTGVGSWLNIQSKFGDGAETAWSDLTTAFPTEWTANHRGRGLAQFLVGAVNPGSSDATKRNRLYQTGQPTIQALFRGVKVYDPRDASTGWTENGALICLHYLRAFGIYPDSSINFTRMGAAADWADQTVTTLSGTEVRSRLGGAFKGDVSDAIVLELMECAGLRQAWDDDGKFYFAPAEDDPTPELIFPFEHILTWSYETGPEAVDRANTVVGKYYSPEQDYSIATIPTLAGAPWASVNAEIAKYRKQVREIELRFCPSASQAQRIMRRVFHMERADAINLQTTLAGLALEDVHCATFMLDGFGEDGTEVLPVKAIIEDFVEHEADGTCEIIARVVPDILKTPFAPSVDEVAPPETIVAGQIDSIVPSPPQVSEVAQVQYPGGAYELRASLDGLTGIDAGQDVSAELLFNTYTAQDNPEASALFDTVSEAFDGNWYGFEAGDYTGDKLRLRPRYIGTEDEPSNLGPELIVSAVVADNTTPAAPTLSGSYNETDEQYELTTLTAPSDISVVSLVLEDNGSEFARYDTKPLERKAASGPLDLPRSQPPTGGTITLIAYAEASDGSRSPASASITYTRPS